MLLDALDQIQNSRKKPLLLVRRLVYKLSPWGGREHLTNKERSYC